MLDQPPMPCDPITRLDILHLSQCDTIAAPVANTTASLANTIASLATRVTQQGLERPGDASKLIKSYDGRGPNRTILRNGRKYHRGYIKIVPDPNKDYSILGYSKPRPVGWRTAVSSSSPTSTDSPAPPSGHTCTLLAPQLALALQH